jgi:hypothetical protein
VGISGVSSSGERVSGDGFGNFAGTEDTGAFLQNYEFIRVAGEWKSVPLDPPFSEFFAYQVTSISPDFKVSLWSARTPAQPLLEGLYSGPPTGPLLRIGPGEPPGVVEAALTYVGASDDLSHVLYVDSSQGGGEVSHLWPGDTTALGRLPSLYEYAGTGNTEPRLVGVTNVGTPPNIGASHLISNCGIFLGSRPIGDGYNAVSADGKTIFFTAASASSCEESSGPPVNEIYARVDAAETVPISEPTSNACSKCIPSPKADAQFRGASLDGSRAFFTSEQPLLTGITGAGPYLYEYDFNRSKGKKLTLVSNDNPAGVLVQGVARVSEDGSHVYFVAQGALTGPNREGRSPVAGLPNLYVWTGECGEGSTACESPVERTELVATLSSADREDWGRQDFRPVQATSDGHYLVFQSVADLTSDQEGQQEAGQIFRYDAQAGVLTRVSRGQEGYNNDGNSSVYPAKLPRQGYVISNPVQRSTYLAISEDGSRVFFSSEDALTPQAVSGISNIYEYHEGRVGLISDGSDFASRLPFAGIELIGTDASGLDVFFSSADRLVPQDTDTQTDIYDARIGGGPPPAVNQAPCLGDSCQGGGSVLPTPPMTAPVVGEAQASPQGETVGVRRGTQKRKVKHKPRHKKRKRKAKGGAGKRAIASAGGIR